MGSKKMVLVHLFQGMNGDKNGENELINTVGEGESGTDGESSIDKYTLSHVKQRGIEKLLYNREPSLALCDDLEEWVRGVKEDSRERGYMYNIYA